MHIILTGATGNVGAPLLKRCLSLPEVTRVSILSRRQFTLPAGDGLDIQKAHLFIHENYSIYPDELLTSLKGADACVWAQGVSQREVTKDEYVRITHDCPLAAAKAFSTLSTAGHFNFVYVSSEGADPTEKSATLFGSIKGRTEKALLDLPSTPEFSALRVFNVRPGYVDPPERHRARSTIAAIFDYTAPLLRRLAPNQVSPAGRLSKVLLDLATGDGSPLPAGEGSGIEGDGRTLRNTAVRRLGDS